MSISQTLLHPDRSVHYIYVQVFLKLISNYFLPFGILSPMDVSFE